MIFGLFSGTKTARKTLALLLLLEVLLLLLLEESLPLQEQHLHLLQELNQLLALLPLSNKLPLTS